MDSILKAVARLKAFFGVMGSTLHNTMGLVNTTHSGQA
jgi:hypothetical protein